MGSQFGTRAQQFFIEEAPAAIAMFDAEMRFVAVSRSFLSLQEFQVNPAEVIGRSNYEIFPDLPQNFREINARVLAGEELADSETPFPRRDGRTDWIRWRMKPWRTAEGATSGPSRVSQRLASNSGSDPRIPLCRAMLYGSV
jgi:PAS domain S-box-containing protein